MEEIQESVISWQPRAHGGVQEGTAYSVGEHSGKASFGQCLLGGPGKSNGERERLSNGETDRQTGLSRLGDGGRCGVRVRECAKLLEGWI